jgi:hypothetical protein
MLLNGQQGDAMEILCVKQERGALQGSEEPRLNYLSCDATETLAPPLLLT